MSLTKLNKKYYRRIDDYYKIRNHQLQLNKTSAESYCGLCYNVTCDHDVERIVYEDANKELSTWGEVALQECDTAYIRVGEVSVYPAWPSSVAYPEEHMPYRVFPIPKGAIFGGIVAHSTIEGYNADLTLNSKLSEVGRKIARFGNGMYWGYYMAEDFYVIKLFREYWRDIKRKTIPSKDVTGLEIPEFEVDFEIDGYHFLPRLVTSNADFQTKYFRL